MENININRFKFLAGIIEESKNIGYLYHYTSKQNLKSILKDNKLKSTEEYYMGEILYYISFTRNKNFHLKNNNFGVKTDVRITIDGEKLSNNYKIKPFAYMPGWDYENNYDYDWLEDENPETVRDFLNGTGEYDEMEERITKSNPFYIDNFKKYIIDITIF